MFKKALLILYFIINLIIVSNCSNISVGNNESFKNITSAIEASSPGDNINVYSGTYNEKISINKSNLVFRGIGETKPVIQQSVSILADGITFEGFNVTDTFKISSKNNILSNNSFNRLSLGMIPISSRLYENALWPLSDPFIYQGMPRIREIKRGLDPKNFEVMNNYIDSSNYAGGGLVYFLNNISNKIINRSSNAGYIYCFNCSNISISGLDDCQYIYFINTTDSEVDSNNLRGLSLQNSSNNLINYNKFKYSNNFGIDLLYSDNNSIRGNYMDSCLGIRLTLSAYNLLKDNSINGSRGNDEGYHQNGIALAFSNGNTLLDNIVSNNDAMGIILSYSGGNKLRNNTLLKNTYNFGSKGESNDIDLSNTADGKPICYLEDVSDKIIDDSVNSATIYCISCNNITIKQQTLNNNLYGIYLYDTQNTTIENNEIFNNSIGIIYADSDINIKENNKIHDNVDIWSPDEQNIYNVWNLSQVNPRFYLWPCRSCGIDPHVSIPINSKPKGAEIWIDGEYTGYKTKHSIPFNDREYHTLDLKKSGYNDLEMEFNVNDTYDIDVPLVKA